MNPLVVKFLPIPVALIVGFVAGWEWRDRSADLELAEAQARYDAAVIESQRQLLLNQAQARAIERIQAERIQAVEEATALRNREREVVTVEVEREVIRYVERQDRPAVLLPADWVRIHDTAALGRRAGLPGTAVATPEPDAASSGATDAQALGVIARNYQTCHAIADQLTALQQWVAATQTTMRKTP